MKKIIKLTIPFFILFGLIVACDNGNDDPAAELFFISSTLEINNAQDLGADFDYEGWLVINGTRVSVGKFDSIDLPLTFQTSLRDSNDDLRNATGFEVTIEPANDPSPLPSNTRYLAGVFENDTARIRSRDGLANFAGSSGRIRMRTPTDGNNGNNRSGVYFARGGNLNPSLELPVLPSGWKYEGWARIDGINVSTGKFTAVDMQDESAIFSETVDPPPSVPGEDFLLNAPDGLTFPTELRGQTVFITAEPFPDNSPEPFQIIPLVHQIADDAQGNSNITIEDDPEGLRRRNLSGRFIRSIIE